MYYIALYVLSFLLFTQGLRFSQKKAANTVIITAVNYVVCAIICIAYFSFLGFPDLKSVEWRIWVTGFSNGLLYFLNLVSILTAYRFVGVGITSASVGVSLIIPVILSWALWDEAMPISRWLAVILTPLAITFMRPLQGIYSKFSLKGNLALLGCFLCAGAIRTIHKYVNVIAGSEPEELRVYQATLWAAAAAGSAFYVAIHRLPYQRMEILLGGMVGVFNLFTLFFTLLSLSVVPAVIFFPPASAVLSSSTWLFPGYSGRRDW